MARNDDLIAMVTASLQSGFPRLICHHPHSHETLELLLETLNLQMYASLLRAELFLPIDSFWSLVASISGQCFATSRLDHPGRGKDGSASAASVASHTGMVDVVVPDTFVAFLRLLIFIYTDTLPDGNDEALLEDLLSADRYDITDMKSMCESMLVPSEQNWLGLLKVAELVRSTKLLGQVQGFLRDNFTILNEKVDGDDGEDTSEDLTYLQYIRKEYPVLAEIVFLSVVLLSVATKPNTGKQNGGEILKRLRRLRRPHPFPSGRYCLGA